MTQNTDAASPQVNNQNVHPVFGPILDSIAPKVGYTPGPWRMEKSKHTYGFFAIESGSGPITYVTLSNSECNSSLIAAAPELLEALEQLLTVSAKGAYYPHEEDWFEEVSHKAKAAIAKAKGGNLG